MKDHLEALLLEDQDDDVALILRTLQKGRLPVNVRVVKTREGFLQALVQGPWDFILSDYNLPRFNGGEALGLLREQDEETPFILVTGEIGEERAADLMRHGANDFVKKDRLERLVPAIERELREAVVRRTHHESMGRLLRLGQAVDQSGEEIVMTDPAGQITYVNAAFVAVTGYSTEEALGKHPLELLGNQADAALHQELLESIQRLGHWQGRFPGRTKAGSPLLLESRIAPILGDQGCLLGFIGTHRDITKQAEAEIQMEQAHRMEAIGTLAGGIAHDFNNMLMAIRGFAEIVQLRVGDSSLKGPVDGILRASDRARDLVQQILAFSRRTPLERKPTEVRAVMREALRFIRATVPSSITIQEQIRSRAWVLADSTELQRIIVNLCTNSMLAMQGGIGILSLDVDEWVQDGRSDCPQAGLPLGRYVRIQVADSGCGMTAEVLSRIFEPFFTTRSTTGGTGMGLSVVHGLVASMGGAIAVQSTPGLGSTFEILLPVNHASSESPALHGLPPVSGTGRLLFIDDEQMLCDLAGEMLRSLGYTTRTFTDPVQAIALFESDPGAFDLVLTDMTMPGMTGDLVAEALLALRPDLPVILCSGNSEKIEHTSLSAQGLSILVEKPFEWSSMSHTIQRCLQPKTQSKGPH